MKSKYQFTNTIFDLSCFHISIILFTQKGCRANQSFVIHPRINTLQTCSNWFYVKIESTTCWGHPWYWCIILYKSSNNLPGAACLPDNSIKNFSQFYDWFQYLHCHKYICFSKMIQLVSWILSVSQYHKLLLPLLNKKVFNVLWNCFIHLDWHKTILSPLVLQSLCWLNRTSNRTLICSMIPNLVTEVYIILTKKVHLKQILWNSISILNVNLKYASSIL